MPRWGRGKYGRSGGQAIGEKFDQFADAGRIRSDPMSARGFEARLRYLLERRGGGEALAAQGVRPRQQQVVDWLTGDVTPRRSTREAVDRAYLGLRRRNVARSLRGRLSEGRRVTVQPLPDTAVPQHQKVRQGQFQDREVTIRPATFDRMVDAWEDGDQDELDDLWVEDVASDMGSPPEAYYEVQYVGFSI